MHWGTPIKCCGQLVLSAVGTGIGEVGAADIEADGRQRPTHGPCTPCFGEISEIRLDFVS